MKQLTKEEIKNCIEWVNARTPLNGLQKEYIEFIFTENTKQLMDEIAKLKASKSEANEAVEFAEWLSDNCDKTVFKDKWYYFSCDSLGTIKTSQQLHEIFKTRNNK